MFHNYETEKITCKASNMAGNLQLYRVVWFFHPRSLCTTMHLMFFSERPPIYALCMTISGGRNKQLDIIAGFLLRHWLYAWFSSAENVRRYMRRAWTLKSDTPFPPANRTSETEHHWVMGGKKRNISRCSVLSWSRSIKLHKTATNTAPELCTAQMKSHCWHNVR